MSRREALSVKPPPARMPSRTASRPPRDRPRRVDFAKNVKHFALPAHQAHRYRSGIAALAQHQAADQALNVVDRLAGNHQPPIAAKRDGPIGKHGLIARQPDRRIEVGGCHQEHVARFDNIGGQNVFVELPGHIRGNAVVSRICRAESSMLWRWGQA